MSTHIHIDTIYESRAFQLLAQGMKDREAVKIAFILMSVDQDAFRSLDGFCDEILKERDDDDATELARFDDDIDVRFKIAHNSIFYDDPTDVKERADRFLEEAIEVYRALGGTYEDIGRLMDYSWERPSGAAPEELGDVMMTLRSLVHEMKLEYAEIENQGLQKMIDRTPRIREKRKTRHGRGPLPGYDPEPPLGGQVGSTLNCPHCMDSRMERFDAGHGNIGERPCSYCCDV